MMFRCTAIALAGLSATTALAQATHEFQRGEQPVYGQKFYPGEPMGNPDERQGNWFVELNPLALTKRGVDFQFERRVGDKTTLGADLVFSQTEHESGDVTGSSRFMGAAPKLRWYPMEYLSGVFFGLKVYVAQVSWDVKSEVKLAGDAIEVSKNSMIYAPVAHVGYRLINWGKFTFSAYLGGGLNLGLPDFDGDLSGAKELALESRGVDDNWSAVAGELKDEYGMFRPDFGVTVGILFD